MELFDRKLVNMPIMYDAMMGHNMDMKMVTTYISEKRFTMVMYHAMGGKDIKSMEMVYSRKKQAYNGAIIRGETLGSPLNFLKIKALK